MLRRPETKRVAEFLYDILVVNAPAKGYARQVAERMGVPYPTLARYWQGQAVFPAGLVSPLFLATDQDRRIAEFFLLEDSDYCLSRKEPSGAPLDLERALVAISQIKGEISGIYLKATGVESDAGTRISAVEAREMEQALTRLLKTTEELRAVIKELHRAGLPCGGR